MPNPSIQSNLSGVIHLLLTLVTAPKISQARIISPFTSLPLTAFLELYALNKCGVKTATALYEPYPTIIIVHTPMSEQHACAGGVVEVSGIATAWNNLLRLNFS